MIYKVINLLSQVNNGVWRPSPYSFAFLLPMQQEIELGQLTTNYYGIDTNNTRLFNWNFQNVISSRKVDLTLDVEIDLPITDDYYVLCRTDVSSCRSSSNRYIAICQKI